MSQDTGLLVDLEEDLGLSNLASKNDQRTCASFCHLELIRYELGFLGKLDEEPSTSRWDEQPTRAGTAWLGQSGEGAGGASRRCFV